jgi:multidrug efflux pump subunit AcrA (membrane-fusion protein)
LPLFLKGRKLAWDGAPSGSDSPSAVSRLSIARTIDGDRNDLKGRNQFGLSSRVLLSALLAGVLIIGVGGWAAQAKLAGAVIASGYIVVPEQVRTIQHRDGGIVSEIGVGNGDAVKQGDVLLRLDDTQTRVKLTIIESQLQQMVAMQARLRAERDGLAAIDFGVKSLPPSIVAGETKLFEENRRMLASQKQQLKLQSEQLSKQMQGFAAQSDANDREAAIIDQELQKLDRLLAKGLISFRLRSSATFCDRRRGLKARMGSWRPRALKSSAGSASWT